MCSSDASVHVHNTGYTVASCKQKRMVLLKRCWKSMVVVVRLVVRACGKGSGVEKQKYYAIDPEP